MMNSVGHIKSNDDEINSRELTPPNDIKNQFTWIDNERCEPHQTIRCLGEQFEVQHATL
jgi:hypothetical protein